MESKSDKSNWWQTRTSAEKFLLVLTTIFIIVIIFLFSNLMMKSSSEKLPQKVCMTEQCIRSSASILEKIDKNIDPCDDFYKFACGNFIKNTAIPDDKTLVTSFSRISDKVILQLMKVYEESIRDDDPRSLKLIKTAYNSCMNTTQIEKEGLLFVKTIFKELGGWPVLEPNHWNEKSFDWKQLMFRLKRIGWRRTFFFSMYVYPDLKDSSKNILTITQPCFPYDRLKKGLNDSAVQATYEYLVNLATLFGAEPIRAIAEMKEVINFEINFAKIMIPYEERKNTTLEYNPMTIRELQSNFPSIAWLQVINNYLSPIDMYTSDDTINVGLPIFLEKLEDLLLTTKRRTLANYMFSRVIRDSINQLPEAFRKAELDYMKKVYGKSEVTPRWKQCVYGTNRLHIAVSSIYVKNIFDRSVKHKVTELLIDIKGSFLEKLRTISWMDRKTKKNAILKAEKMSSFIGYPDQLLDDELVEGYYEGLELTPDEYYLKTIFNISLFTHMKTIQKLREPVIKPDWRSQAYTYYVNAFYDQKDNAIELLAAILQENFFDPNRPQYMNYGGIGEVIGHEITHGFDDHGRQYDQNGNLVDWWEPETNITFARKSQCLVEQYSNYSIPEIGMTLNGIKTLGENIADNGGIKIAYRGYLKWIGRNGEEPSLPGLSYTPKQMFWISTATSWCAKYKKEMLKQLVTLGHHSPNYFRVIVPFMNSEYFAKDFNCPLGSPMNPKQKCQVW